MNKEKFKIYADIKSQIKDLEKQATEIKGELEEEMKDNEVDEVRTEFGTFSYVSSVRYEYSDNIKDLEQQIRQLKKEEEKHNIAEQKIKKYLRYVENNGIK